MVGLAGEPEQVIERERPGSHEGQRGRGDDEHQVVLVSAVLHEEPLRAVSSPALASARRSSGSWKCCTTRWSCRCARCSGASWWSRAARPTSSSTTYVVDKLAARGLVRRRPGKEDRREVLLALTPAGRRLIARIFPPTPRRCAKP